MTTADLKLRDFLDMTSDKEQGMFLMSTKKKTSQMKYDEFLKHALPPHRSMIQEFLENTVNPTLAECKTVKDIEAIAFPALPDNIRDSIIDFVDSQKSLNIVEKTYLCLDLVRGVSAEIYKWVRQAVLHYGNSIQQANQIGGRIIGLNGRPLN